MHWNERGDAAGPVWRITFGQHSRTLASVQRDVDAKTGRVFARDALHSSFTELDQKPERFTRLLLPVGRTFDSLWPAVKDAVRKQDPRYRPYAVTLVTQLGEYQRAPSGGYLWMAHIRFVRETPSWMWDDLEAHLGWRTDGQAVLDFSPPERLRGPRQVIPIVIYNGLGPWGTPLDLAELIELFVSELPARLRQVSDAAAMGDLDKAFEQMDKIRLNRPATAQILFDPQFDPLRADPRFNDFLKRRNIELPSE